MATKKVDCFLHKDQELWYEVYGSGLDVILLIPGPIGTSNTDFYLLLNENFGINLKKFTVVAVDPPGIGRSGPSQRQYDANVYRNDCEAYGRLMKHLNHGKYSVIGWSEGAKVALQMAIRYDREVEALILIDITYIVTKKALDELQTKSNIENWDPIEVDRYLTIYGSEQKLSEQWNRYIEFNRNFSTLFRGDIFYNKYNAVICPVLIVYAEDDPICGKQPDILLKKLPNAKSHRFMSGGHGCHNPNAKRFQSLAEEFIRNRRSMVVDLSKVNFTTFI